MKKFILLILFLLLMPTGSRATSNLASQLKGRILLQVEGVGQSWYVDPVTQQRAFLGRPDDAFRIMRELGLGISEKDFNSFKGYAPRNLSGRILLRVQANGEAYYINPVDLKMHYLGRPADAFRVMRELGLGITNKNLNNITVNNRYRENVDLNNIGNIFNTSKSSININSISASDHIRGDINTAQYVIVEFSDIDCPFCQRFHSTMQQILDDYQGKVAWVYRHFPLDSLHPEARKKSEATECVAALGGNEAFWTYLDRLYEENVDDLVGFAKAVGVNETSFNYCLNRGTYKDIVQSQYQDAINSGGQGTPYSVAITRDGQRVPISGALPLANMKSIIDPLLGL